MSRVLTAVVLLALGFAPLAPAAGPQEKDPPKGKGPAADALFSEGRDVFVYVPHRKKETDPWGEEKKPVKIGKTDGTFTQIISGIEAGQEVWVKRPKLTEKEQKESEGNA